MTGEIKSFEDLECFKKCKKLRLDVSSIIKTFPDKEQYRLTDHILRCSLSVTNNIAEGYGRFHYRENAQFCRHSRGSLYELLDHFQIGFEEGDIDQEVLNKLNTQTNDCIKIRNGFIKYLVRQTSSTKPTTN